MPRSRARVRWTRGAVALILLGIATPAATPVAAQKRPPQEFTQQGILVAPFWVVGASTPSMTRVDLRTGRKAGEAVRDRLADLVDRREARVISSYDMRMTLGAAGIPEDTAFTVDDLRLMGRFFRIDEIVAGTLSRSDAGIRLDASILLYRDVRMRQPLPAVTARDAAAAARALARRVADARSQMKYVRRCENALRVGDTAVALRHARQGVAESPAGVLVRTCLIRTLAESGAPASEVLAESGRVLALDSVAPHAIEYAAKALDVLQRRPEAAVMWLRLAATDSTNEELIERVVFAMAEHGNSRAAEPLIVRACERNPENIRLQRQQWRVANDVRNWPLAVATGEHLLAVDAEAARDSVFYLRLATAYRMHGQPFKAVETVARGVSAFPRDARMYALYTQFIKEEADTALGRGLALHPGSAELAALSARELRARGRTAEALAASRRAVALDSSIAQGRLLVAQGEFDLGRPDSALVTLQRAVAAGEDAATVAQFALAKGNTLYRAANGTRTRADFQLAMRFLWFADSLRPTVQTKFLLGAAALSVAQTALADAPRLAVREESCAVAHVGADAIPVARASLDAGRDVSPDATKQFLDYLDVIAPYAERQITSFCAPAPR